MGTKCHVQATSLFALRVHLMESVEQELGPRKTAAKLIARSGGGRTGEIREVRVMASTPASRRPRVPNPPSGPVFGAQVSGHRSADGWCVRAIDGEGASFRPIGLRTADIQHGIRVSASESAQED